MEVAANLALIIGSDGGLGAALLAVLAGLSPADTGCLVDCQGEKLPF